MALALCAACSGVEGGREGGGGGLDLSCRDFFFILFPLVWRDCKRVKNERF